MNRFEIDNLLLFPGRPFISIFMIFVVVPAEDAFWLDTNNTEILFGRRIPVGGHESFIGDLGGIFEIDRYMWIVFDVAF